MSKHEIAATVTSADLSPILCSFPGALPQNGLALKAYKRKSGNSLDKQIHLYAQTDRIEYYGDIHSTSADTGCKYAVGIYDKTTNKVHIREAPHIQLNQSVRAVSAAVDDSNLASRVSKVDRRALGEAFGTRKALSAIKSYDRGKIDVESLATSSSHLSSEIESVAMGMPSIQDIQNTSDESRLVPPYNATTTVLEEVYKLDDIVGSKELASIDVDALQSEQVVDVQSTPSPVESSAGKYAAFVQKRITGSLKRKDISRVRLLLALDFMIKFSQMKDGVLNRRAEFYAIMGVAISTEMEVFLRGQFTISKEGRKPGTKRESISGAKKALLLSYICALALHIDNFTVEVNSLAKDLSMTPSKVLDLFRQLGCQVDVKTANGEVTKQARLVAPVVFPRPRRGAQKRR